MGLEGGLIVRVEVRPMVLPEDVLRVVKTADMVQAQSGLTAVASKRNLPTSGPTSVMSPSFRASRLLVREAAIKTCRPSNRRGRRAFLEHVVAPVAEEPEASR
jgi:hypothetical protein